MDTQKVVTTVADGKTTQSGKLAPQQICAFWGLLFFFFQVVDLESINLRVEVCLQ